MVASAWYLFAQNLQPPTHPMVRISPMMKHAEGENNVQRNSHVDIHSEHVLISHNILRKVGHNLRLRDYIQQAFFITFGVVAEAFSISGCNPNTPVFADTHLCIYPSLIPNLERLIPRPHWPVQVPPLTTITIYTQSLY